jgi:hypothetical protein
VKAAVRLIGRDLIGYLSISLLVVSPWFEKDESIRRRGTSIAIASAASFFADAG